MYLYTNNLFNKNCTRLQGFKYSTNDAKIAIDCFRSIWFACIVYNEKRHLVVSLCSDTHLTVRCSKVVSLLPLWSSKHLHYILPHPRHSRCHPSTLSICAAVVLSVVHCSNVKWCAVQCSAVQCSSVQCSAVQCSAVQFCAVQCSAVQCRQVGQILSRQASAWYSPYYHGWKGGCTLYKSLIR